MNESTIAAECDHVSKKFADKYAVHAASFRVEAGKVHALVGENGAGKSTLLGMISGRVSVTEGTVSIFGTALTQADPRQSRMHGLVVVYQELTMIPALTAAQNMFLGQNASRGGFLQESAMRSRFISMCKEFDVDINPDTAARDLSVSQQQIVEILRGVQARGRILILDEPSAALAEHERETLYKILNRLRSQGTTIIFVSHNLDEVLQLSDTITVLRDGEIIRTAPRSEWTKSSLVHDMVGKDVVVERRTDRHQIGALALSVKNVQTPPAVNGITLTARRGEIVGLWGLVGSGRTTFMRSLAGLEPSSSGELEVEGRELPWPGSARTAIDYGIAHVTESRKHGLVLGMDGASNYWMGRRTPSPWWLSPVREVQGAKDKAVYFGFKPERLTEPVKNLSGGNQQKVLLAKWAGHSPKIMLVDEPTRGIDVGAKSEVMASLIRLAKDGATIIVTSSELEEVLAICDRLLVFSHGRVVREIDTANDPYTVRDIVKFGFGEDEVA
ncbi:sugar ABC transporter ATP-binding protein [Pseudarthrobacter raffinosi]|uniref:sugar ABC transporter ATP-binding protein n=1 Tax=Pseudarthrobacter raffinosi TaxID=2953651 RepID=UPI00208EE17A|nr:sugar ABC transporter ATP-binding protein [Pseudarthrobacter sp. MDT3-9]MCO4253535.1 sugar ABC transporter ATP-binding protein [Pseudarthrobacter sp. MDT3-9]